MLGSTWKILVSVGCIASGIAGLSAADAQETSAPEGTIQRGAFLFTPVLNLGVEYNDNVFGTSVNKESDTVAFINPTVGVETTWSRHAITGDLSLIRREYLDFDDESVWNWSLGGAGRLDVRRDTYFDGGLRYSKSTEARTSAGAANQAAEPIEYDSFNASLGARKPLGRLIVRGELGLDDTDYDDAPLFGGGIVDQDFRDHIQKKASVQANYPISPDTSLFGRFRVNEREYDLAPPPGGLLRDSSGFTIDGGAEFDIGGLARGSVGAGYTKQDYDAATLSAIDSFSVDASVEWYPTQLTTVTVQASRGVNDSAIAGSGGYVATAFGVTISHELRRNITVSSGFTYGEDGYGDLDRTDERFGVSAGLTYAVNRNVDVRGSWDYTEQDSSGAAGNQDYERNTFGLSLILRR